MFIGVISTSDHVLDCVVSTERVSWTVMTDLRTVFRIAPAVFNTALTFSFEFFPTLGTVVKVVRVQITFTTVTILELKVTLSALHALLIATLYQRLTVAAACVCSSISVGTTVTHLLSTHVTPVPQPNGTQVLPTQAPLTVCTNFGHSLPTVLLVTKCGRLSLDDSLAV